MKTIHVLVCSGLFTQTMNGEPRTGDRVELLKAFTNRQEAADLLNTGTADVAEPDKWGVRAIYLETVELD